MNIHPGPSCQLNVGQGKTLQFVNVREVFGDALELTAYAYSYQVVLLREIDGHMVRMVTLPLGQSWFGEYMDTLRDSPVFGWEVVARYDAKDATEASEE